MLEVGLVQIHLVRQQIESLGLLTTHITRQSSTQSQVYERWSSPEAYPPARRKTENILIRLTGHDLSIKIEVCAVIQPRYRDIQRLRTTVHW